MECRAFYVFEDFSLPPFEKVFRKGCREVFKGKCTAHGVGGGAKPENRQGLKKLCPNRGFH